MGARVRFYDDYLLIKLYEDVAESGLKAITDKISQVQDHVSFLFICIQDVKADADATAALRKFKETLAKRDSMKVCFIAKESQLADAPDHQTALGRIKGETSEAVLKLHELEEQLGPESADEMQAKIERLEERVRSLGVDPDDPSAKADAQDFKNEPATERVAKLEEKVFAELGKIRGLE